MTAPFFDSRPDDDRWSDRDDAELAREEHHELLAAEREADEYPYVGDPAHTPLRAEWEGAA